MSIGSQWAFVYGRDLPREPQDVLIESWLKELLDAARETVYLDNGAAYDEKIVKDNRTALSELFKEVRNDQTPEIIARIVDDIEKIVQATRFRGWQNTTAGDCEMKKAFMKENSAKIPAPPRRRVILKSLCVYQ